MNDRTLFKLRTFLYYLVIEPWTEKVSLPNLRSVVWVLIIVSSIFRMKYLLLISLFLGVLLHLFYEYRSGKFIYWYRKYKRKKFGVEENLSEGEHEEGNLQEVSSN